MPEETKLQTKGEPQNEFMDRIDSQISNFVKKGELQLPQGYSVQNSLKAAWLMIMETETKAGEQALVKCTKTSIYNALLNTAIQGLNPAKGQCYYIMYGKKLTMLRSFAGTAAVTMRVAKLQKPPAAQVIYEGDTLEYEIINGIVKNISHKQKFGNIDETKIKGAYCTLTLEDGADYSQIMTLDEIHSSWSFGQTKGTSPAHTKTPGEMCKKTVITRTCKMLLRASNDEDVLSNSFFNSDDDAEEARVNAEVEENANKIPLYVENYEVDPETGEATEDEGSPPPVSRPEGARF
jgi:recombination protein RecT